MKVIKDFFSLFIGRPLTKKEKDLKTDFDKNVDKWDETMKRLLKEPENESIRQELARIDWEFKKIKSRYYRI